MPLRRISSLLTFVYKFIVPPFFVLAVVLFVLFDPRLNARMSLVPIAISISLIVYLVVVALRIKWVAIDEGNGRLYVSNYLKEISIPLSDISDVTEFRFSDPRWITIHLSRPCEFGEKIVFFGTYRFGGWLAGPHPIVDELLDLAHR